MSLQDAVLVGLIIAFATIVQFSAGFGFSLSAVPLLAIVLDTRSASMIATVLNVVTSGYQAWHFRADVDRALVKRLSLALFAGMPFGLALFEFAPERTMRMFLGFSTLAMVLLLARGLDLSDHGPAVDWGAGTIAGVLSTSLSTNGPPLVFVLQGRRLPPDRFRATIATIFTVAAVVSLSARGAVGGFTHEVWLGLSVSPIPLGIGIFVGMKMRNVVSGARFRPVVLGLLGISAVSALVAAFTG